MEANKTPLLEVLNNLASIHHEMRNDQTQLLDIDRLGRLKLVAAQLYMEVDIELLAMEFPDLQETESEMSLDPQIDTENAEVVIAAAEEVQEEVVVDVIVEPRKVVEELPELSPIAAPIPTPIAENVPVDKAPSVHSVSGLIGQFPLSRRFEFISILFGGDTDNMGLFVQEVIDAPNAAVRGDVYDRWYEQKQWRRRDESAGDMWRMIKRIFTQ